MTTRTVTPASTAPLTPEHLRELALAQERGAKIRKTARVANFNGWVTAIIAASAAMFLVFSFSIVDLLVTGGLAVVAYNEFRGRDRLLRYDPSAATLLGWNQLGFLAMITLYCGWNMVSGLTQPVSLPAEYRELLGSDKEMAGLVRSFTVIFYGLVIVLSVVFQGLTALYYFSRRKQIESYVRDTPQWVRDVQRASAGS